MHAQTRQSQTPDPDCRPSAPWASLSLREQRAFLSSLETNRDRKNFLEAEANRILGMGRSGNYQRNADLRAEHTDGRRLFDEFDGDKNNSDDNEPSELMLDDSQMLDVVASDDAEEQLPVGQDQESSTALASSWVDCSGVDALSLWGANEWNAVLALTPNNKNRDVLVGLARGMSAAEIADAIGRTPRHVRNIIKRLWNYVRGLDVATIAAHLDDPITDERVVRRPPSRAGRKPRHVAATGIVVALPPAWGGLWGAHHQPQRRGRGPDRGPRRPRARPVCEGQLSFFDLAA